MSDLDLGPSGPSEENPQPIGPPFLPIDNEDPQAIFAALQPHAREYGFSIKVRSRKPGAITWTCTKEGKYDPRGKRPDVHESKRRKETGTKKTGCQYRVLVKKPPESLIWGASIVNDRHNHPPSTTPSVHPIHRIGSLTEEHREKIIYAARKGNPPRIIHTMMKSDYPDLILKVKDIYNVVQKARLEQLNGRSPIQWLLEVSIYFN